MQKKGIRYLRFSSDGQSHSSIERQDMYTASWFERNEATIIDTFIDEGYSAKTFDRPDFKKLQDFISKHYKHVDYLVVDQLDRFSRDAAEGLLIIKQLQKKYSIQIVSVTEGIIFDYNTPGSFFRTGLQLLLAEDNNIDRSIKINAGIYTAKAKEGRYIGSCPPFGYIKNGTGKERKLIIHEEQAAIIRYIYQSYLQNVPLYIIYKEVVRMGCKARGNSLITKILSNPIYAGKQYVKPCKHLPGGIYPALHEPIIDLLTWNRVQEKLKGPKKTKTIIANAFPLRGLLKCHCGSHLTGAPSRGRHGNWYNYYKCNKGPHNNINAKKAHEQLHETLKWLSLSDRVLAAVQEEAQRKLKEKMKDHRQQLQRCNRELEHAEQQKMSLEEKWINNQLNFETYQRWHSDINNRLMNLKAQQEKFSRGISENWLLLQEQLPKLGDLDHIFSQARLTDQQELLRIVFDNSLYYQSKTYRTPYVMPVFTHNAHILKQKQLLIIDGWDYQNAESPSRWS